MQSADALKESRPSDNTRLQQRLRVGLGKRHDAFADLGQRFLVDVVNANPMPLARQDEGQRKSDMSRSADDADVRLVRAAIGAARSGIGTARLVV